MPRRSAALVVLGLGVVGAFACTAASETPPRDGTLESQPSATVIASVPASAVLPSASASAAPPTPPASLPLDKAFAGGKPVKIANPSFSDKCTPHVEAVDFGTDGSIYIAGTFAFPNDSKLTGCDAGVLKLDSKGTIDKTFGNKGFGRVGMAYGEARAVLVGTEGTVLVASNYLSAKADGEPDLSPDLHFARLSPALQVQYLTELSVSIGRLTNGGIHDRGFNAGAPHRFKYKDGVLVSGVVGDGRGYTLVGVAAQAAVGDKGIVGRRDGRAFAARYDTKGAPDKTFGKDGRVELASPRGKIESFIGEHRGTLYFAGREKDGKLFVLRTTSKLEVDASYGDKGHATLPTVSAEAFTTTRLGPNGEVFFAEHGDRETKITKIDPSGQKDAAYGQNGVASFKGAELGGIFEHVITRDGAHLYVEGVIGSDNVVTALDPTGKIDPKLDHVKLESVGDGFLAAVTIDRAGKLVIIQAASASSMLQMGRYVLPR